MSRRSVRVALPDLISNSYFPAVAAIDLGCFAEEGLDASLDLIFPVDEAYRAMRRGDIDFVAGSAHSALAAFPEWDGVKLIAAQGQGMYWFLVMRADLGIARGDLSALKGRKIGAAPWVEMGLRRLLVAAGLDLENDGIEIGPVPGAKPEPGQVVNFGVTAAKALADGKIDGFWANGMGTEVAVTEGVGTIVLDVRRGDGPAEGFNFTMASIAATDRLIAEEPEVAAAAVRAVGRAHRKLRDDVTLATKVAQGRFPAPEAGLIAQLIRRDLPYYDLSISPEFVNGMNGFARDLGILQGRPAYEDVVATRFSPLWAAKE
jgi:NitT/TauT family transport system substrate-binding protein